MRVRVLMLRLSVLLQLRRLSVLLHLRLFRLRGLEVLEKLRVVIRGAEWPTSRLRDRRRKRLRRRRFNARAVLHDNRRDDGGQ